MSTPAGRLGIIVGGSPAPSVNSTISAAVVEAINSGLEIVGIYDGLQNLMDGNADVVRSLSIPDPGYTPRVGLSFVLPGPTRPATRRT